MKKLAIIGAAQAATNYAINAREMGIETHCFAWEEGATAKNDVDYFYPISIMEKETIVSICRNIGINGVVATTELTIPIAAYIANELDLIGMPVAVAENITDKYKNRNKTSHIEGFNHPKYIEITTEKELLNGGLNYPYIIKPTSKGGKKGITVVKSDKDVHDAFEYAINEQGNNNPIIVEEFIEGGIEYSVESLSYKGKHYIIQITQKQSSGPPHCVELGHHQPARISNDMWNSVVSVIEKALTDLGLENGPCHTEIKIKNGQIYLIEFNARPGGDKISYPLVDLSSGYNYLKGAISIALDSFEIPELGKLQKHYAGIVFVTEQNSAMIPLFKNCEDYSWCYKKHKVENGYNSIVHNYGRKANFFMYYSKEFPKELEDLIEKQEWR